MPAPASILLLFALGASADGVASAAAPDDPAGPPPGASANTTPGAPPGAPQGLVVVLRPVGSDELTEAAFTRIAGELSAARYRVLILPLENRIDPARQVERVAAEQEPVAAVALARVHSAAGDAVAIWTCDRRTRRTTILRIQTTLPHPDNQAAVLAVEAIELIRASIGGLDTALSLPGPTPEGAGTSSSDGAGAVGGPRVAVGSGAAATWDLGLGGPAWSAILWGGLRLTRPLTIHVRLSALGSALHVTMPEGTAQVHRDVAAVGLAWTFLETDALDVFLTAGVGITQVRAVGMAPSPARVHAVTDWPLTATAGAGVRVHVTPAVAIVGVVEGSVMARQLTLRFGDKESAPLSRPGVFTHAGLETTF